METARLVALQDNVDVSLTELRTDMGIASDAADALRQITALRENELPVEELQLLLRFGLLYGADYSAELNVYDDLKNSGELALLTNPDLRRALAKMETQLKLVELFQTDFAAVQQLSVDTYILDRLDMRLLYGAYEGLDEVVGDAKQVFGYTLETPFQNRILLKLDIVNELEIAYADTETALMQVQKIIESQLDAGGN